MQTCPEELAGCSQECGPDPTVMAIRFSVLGAQFLVAVLGLLRERSWKALGVFAGSIAFFLTVPRYLICCRCEGYGRMCYSMYMGKLTSLYLPRVEWEPLVLDNPIGAVLEELTLMTMMGAPAMGLRKSRGLLALYLVLSTVTLVVHFSHSCRHCAETANDWRRECPSAKAAARVFAVVRTD